MQEQQTKLNNKSFLSEFKSLAIKTVILIVVVRVSLALFEVFFAQDFGLKHNHIIIGETIITISVSFVVVSSIRRVLKRNPAKMPPQFIANISFFSIVVISLVSTLILLYIWGVPPQTILVGGGVAAIVVGIGVSTIVGNLLSGALMLTTFPAKIGDSILIINDNIHGTIEEISMLYTKINTENGAQYLVPNSAIIQGSVRMIREGVASEQLPYLEGDRIEISNGSERFSGIVVNISSGFTTIQDEEKEIIIANRFVFEGKSIIIKKLKDRTKT